MRTRRETEERQASLRKLLEDLEHRRQSAGDRRDWDGVTDLQEQIDSARTRLTVLAWVLGEAD
jgi:hypothetical protein